MAEESCIIGHADTIGKGTRLISPNSQAQRFMVISGVQ